MIVDGSHARPRQRDRLDPRRGAAVGQDPARAARVGARDRHLALPRRRRRRGASSSPCGRSRARARAQPRPGDRRRGHPSVRALGGPAGGAATTATAGWSAQLGFVARQELVFGMHVHVGMADPEETIAVANGMRSYVPLLIALVGQLAAVAGRADGPDVEPRADLPRLPARRPAAALRGLERLRAPRRDDERVRHDRGLHLPLVRRAAAPAPRHDRDPRDGLPDPRGAHGRPQPRWSCRS